MLTVDFEESFGFSASKLIFNYEHTSLLKEVPCTH